MDILELKKQAGIYAANMVESGMVVGLGTGSTAIHAVKHIGDRIKSGDLKDVLGIPTSRQTAAQAHEFGVPLTSFADHQSIDITIDGADEIDPRFNLIKGGGGALFQEKIVAQVSKRLVIVADSRKLVPQLGTTWAVPIEVSPFGWETQIPFLEKLGGKPVLRKTEDAMFITDQGNLILDTNFGPITNLLPLMEKLANRVGVIEHGIFFDMATDAIIAAEDGVVEMVQAVKD